MNASRPPHKARPLAEVPTPALAAVFGVLTDIDDTLTRDGCLDPAARVALDNLQVHGVPVLAVTGRPMGWSLPFVQPGPDAWPVAAIVAENGAVALRREGARVLVEYAQDVATRERNAPRLQQVAARILRDVPGAQLARDSAGRVTDIAIDHNEFSHLDATHIEAVLAIMRGEGMSASASSIHVNGWFGTHDKWSGACWIVERLFGRALDRETSRWIYVGDSTNDQAMFGRFELSFGVANLMRFAGELVEWPRYLTAGERGEGFAQVARALLQARATAQCQRVT